MIEEEKQFTNEERQTEEYAAERIAAFEFMSNNLNDEDYGFAQTPENSQKMADFVRGKNWKWSTEALQAAYVALSEAGELTKVLPPTPQPEIVAEEPSEGVSRYFSPEALTGGKGEGNPLVNSPHA